MKKYLTAILLATNACSTSNAIDISACEKFGDNGERGDWIVKCEATDELREIQNRDADAMFLSAGMGLVNLVTMANDTEHVYVNVVPNDCGPNTTGYRIFKNQKEYKDGEMYAITVCE